MLGLVVANAPTALATPARHALRQVGRSVCDALDAAVLPGGLRIWAYPTSCPTRGRRPGAAAGTLLQLAQLRAARLHHHQPEWRSCDGAAAVSASARDKLSWKDRRLQAA